MSTPGTTAPRTTRVQLDGLRKRFDNAPAPAISAEQARRFDRIEQSVDAIAIEVERISENQRYMTKLMAELGANERHECAASDPQRCTAHRVRNRTA